MRLRLLLPILVSAVVLSLAFSVRRHRVESEESAEARLGSSYIKSIAALADKKTMESILEADGAELLEREWEEFHFDLRKIPRLSSWELSGRGKFRVRSSGKNFSGEMSMVQEVHADKSGLKASSRLTKPAGFVRKHETITSITAGSPPVLRVESRIVYERLVPFWMAEDLDSRVREYNKGRVESIVSVVESLADGK